MLRPLGQGSAITAGPGSGGRFGPRYVGNNSSFFLLKLGETNASCGRGRPPSRIRVLRNLWELVFERVASLPSNRSAGSTISVCLALTGRASLRQPARSRAETRKDTQKVRLFSKRLVLMLQDLFGQHLGGFGRRRLSGVGSKKGGAAAAGEAMRGG